jgi:tRNA (guanine37-N1)-methyltransferase
MQIAVVTLFPEMFIALRDYGVSGRAFREELLSLLLINPRDFAKDHHRTVDDRPYGGGPGMLMKTEPLASAIMAARNSLNVATQNAREGLDVKINKDASGATEVFRFDPVKESNSVNPKVIYLSPQGRPLTQAKVQALIEEPSLILICGRYEGVDERILETEVDEEISLGDFVISGGELAAMVLIDAMTRLLPGALGSAESAVEDSFTDGLLDHPQYTRPEQYAGLRVPEVLLSGDHARIARWRLQQRLGATWRKRPELLEAMTLTQIEKELLAGYQAEFCAPK